jgi:hypothetical protein
MLAHTLTFLSKGKMGQEVQDWVDSSGICMHDAFRNSRKVLTLLNTEHLQLVSKAADIQDILPYYFEYITLFYTFFAIEKLRCVLN